MKVIAQALTEEGFRPFGRYLPMTQTTLMSSGSGNVILSEGIGWQDCRTALPLIDIPGSLGVTRGGSSPYAATHMERHMNTQEALFCMREPIVLAVATPGGSDQPDAGDVQAFVIQPGDVVVLDRGVWHDACRGIGTDAHYYWVAACNDGTPVTWEPIAGGPVEVDVLQEPGQ